MEGEKWWPHGPKKSVHLYAPCTCMYTHTHRHTHTSTYTPRTYLNRGEAPPELFPFPFSKALLVAKQQGGLLPREWDGREGRGGGRWEEKESGMSGHPRWGLPAIHPQSPTTHTLLPGLKLCRALASKRQRRERGTRRGKSLAGDTVVMGTQVPFICSSAQVSGSRPGFSVPCCVTLRMLLPLSEPLFSTCAWKHHPGSTRSLFGLYRTKLFF